MKLSDLDKLRTSPEINHSDRENMMSELDKNMKSCDWFTIGIMAQSADEAVNALRNLEKKQKPACFNLFAIWSHFYGKFMEKICLKAQGNYSGSF